MIAPYVRNISVNLNYPSFICCYIFAIDKSVDYKIKLYRIYEIIASRYCSENANNAA